MHALRFQPARFYARSFTLSDTTTLAALRRVAARTIRLVRLAGHEVYTITPGGAWDIEPSRQGGPINGTLTLAAA